MGSLGKCGGKVFEIVSLTNYLETIENGITLVAKLLK